MIYRLLLIFLGMSCSFNLWSQSLTLNEVQTSNSKIFDEDGDSPDWFEIKNETNNAINLLGWSCSDNLENPDKWTFPDTEISPNSYLQIWASGKDRKAIGAPRTLIDQGDIFKFLTPNNNIPSSWITLNYDERSWRNGASGFGYGDNDDRTLLPTGTESVFLRKFFNIEDASDVGQLVLHIDYDDGFVAYINEKEIARANVNVPNPSFDSGTQSDREALIYQGGAPEKFVIENYENLLVDGDNILAIQVLNVHDNSSDLSAIPFLSARFKTNSSAGVSPNPLLGFEELKLHTNFKLASSGETIYLFDQEQILVDSFLIPELCPDISYGKSLDNNAFVYFETPTPEAENSIAYFEEILFDEVAFSEPGGTSTFSTTLNLTAPNNETIHYTLDATLPDSNSPTFNAPIEITEPTVVRAKLASPDKLVCKTSTEVYLIGIDHEIPIVSLVSEPENLFSEDFGIYTFGDDFEQNRPFMGANFWDDKEIPVHFSLFENDGINQYSFNGGTKIFGGWSRANDQRSFSLFARAQYGQSSIDYPIFSNRTYETYQALVLRNSGNDWLRSNIRDAVLTSLMENSVLEIQAYKPVATYINAEYWGMYNLREKINEHYIASKTGIDVEEIDLLEFDGAVVSGGNEEYLDLVEFLESNNLSSDANYQIVSDQIDIENFTVYMLANIYFDNTDWPGNNIKFWKSDETKWRWLMFDTDFGFGIWDQFAYNNNTLNFALEANGPVWPNPPWATLVLRKLNENQEFRLQFINRFADELNTRFLPQAVNQKIDEGEMKVEREIPDHFGRWGGNLNDWTIAIGRMRNFGNRRPAVIKNHIRNRYNLPAVHRATVTNNSTQSGFVRLNSLKLENNTWSGDYFENVPIRLIAVPREGFRFSHWDGDINSTQQILDINMQSAMTFIPVFELLSAPDERIIINEINYNSEPDHDTDDWVEIHNRSADLLEISNWILKDNDDDHSFVMPEGTTIPAHDYLVITRDLSAFKSLNPNVENVIGNLDFGFSGSSDAVRLYNDAGDLKKSVSYTDEAPWPAAADGNGYTLELIHPDLNALNPENWKPVHLHGSPGITNLDVTAIQETSRFENFKVFPNPTNDILNFDFSLSESAEIGIQVFDLQGRLIQSSNVFDLNAGDNTVVVDVSELVRGVYVVKILEDRVAVKGVRVVKI